MLFSTNKTQKRKPVAKAGPIAKKPKVEKTPPKASGKATGDASSPPDCKHKTKKQEEREKNPIHFLRGEYVAVRNETGTLTYLNECPLYCVEHVLVTWYIARTIRASSFRWLLYLSAVSKHLREHKEGQGLLDEWEGGWARRVHVWVRRVAGQWLHVHHLFHQDEEGNESLFCTVLCILHVYIVVPHVISNMDGSEWNCCV